MSRIVLLSDGLTSRTGHRLLSKLINKNEAVTKRILLISLEKYRLSINANIKMYKNAHIRMYRND